MPSFSFSCRRPDGRQAGQREAPDQREPPQEIFFILVPPARRVRSDRFPRPATVAPDSSLSCQGFSRCHSRPTIVESRCAAAGRSAYTSVAFSGFASITRATLDLANETLTPFSSSTRRTTRSWLGSTEITVP